MRAKKSIIAILAVLLILALPSKVVASDTKTLVNAHDLADALGAAVRSEDGTIVLYQDIVIDQTIVFSDQYQSELTIDLNGYTIRTCTNNYALKFTNGSTGSLTIEGTGRWENSKAYGCYFAKWDARDHTELKSLPKVYLNGDIEYVSTDQPFFNGHSNMEINNGMFRTKMETVTSPYAACTFDQDEEDYSSGGYLTINDGTFYSVCKFGGVVINGGEFKRKVYFEDRKNIISSGEFRKGIYADADIKILGGSFYGDGIAFENYSLENCVYEFRGGRVVSSGKYGIRINEMCYEYGNTKITGGSVITTKKNAIGIAVFSGKVILQNVIVSSKNNDGKYGIYYAPTLKNSLYSEGLYVKQTSMSKIHCKVYKYGFGQTEESTGVRRIGKVIILAPQNEQKRYDKSSDIPYRIKGNIKIISKN